VISEIDRARFYCATLDEVRARLDVVAAVCGGVTTLGNVQFDYELVAINLRKSLEHIAFGSLTANRSAYEAAHKDIGKIWRAKQLLERLEKIHKEFYPRPVKPPLITQQQGARHLHFEDKTEGFLTRSDFVDLYDVCSQVIHSRNPFSGNSSITFLRPALEWRQLIRQLLEFHQFRLAGFPQIWIGELQGPDGKSHVSIASPM